MQIQRIQSLLLLIAAVCMAVFTCLPFGYWTQPLEDGSRVIAPITAYDFIGLLIPAVTGTILLLIDIFLFKNFKLQKTVLIISMMMTLVCIGIVIYINCDHATIGTLHWAGSGLLLIATLVASIAAFSRIRADERLLNSYNSLR